MQANDVVSRQTIVNNQIRSKVGNNIARNSIEPQAQTSLPPNSDATIMNDTVIIMDGSGLMGGQATIHPLIRSSIRPLEPRFNIKTKR